MTTLSLALALLLTLAGATSAAGAAFMIAATGSADDTVHLPADGSYTAFAVAFIHPREGEVTDSGWMHTFTASGALFCQTDPPTGACLRPPSAVPLTIPVPWDTVLTFSVFPTVADGATACQTGVVTFQASYTVRLGHIPAGPPFFGFSVPVTKKLLVPTVVDP
jgi:hypothetical protein